MSILPFNSQLTMTSPSSTILIDDDELPPSWRPTDSHVQRTYPYTSPGILIEPSDAASGGTEPSRKRKRAEGKRSDTLVEPSQDTALSGANYGPGYLFQEAA